MSKLTILIDNHDQTYTVSEMRKRLAQVLSKLNGDAEVSFSFHATLDGYKPVSLPPYGKKYQENLTQTAAMSMLDDPSGITPCAVYGELARPEND